MDIDDKRRQRALLFHYAGSEVADIFDTFPEKDKGKDDDYMRAVELLTNYFSPKKNIEYEVHMFRQAKQMSGETMDRFHTRLRKLAKTCEFTDVEREIKTQIIQGCLSQRLRRRALRETISLTQLLDYGRSLETSETQARGMEEKLQSEVATGYVNNTVHEQTRHKKTRAKCYRCNGSYPHTSVCPAMGKTCNSCHKQNHFAAVCRSKQQRKPNKRSGNFTGRKYKKQHQSVNKVEAENRDDTSSSVSDDEYVFTTAVKKNTKSGAYPTATITIGKENIDFVLDTGATVNLIEESDYLRLKEVVLKKTSTKIFPYDSQVSLKILGKFETVIETHERVTCAEFYVVRKNTKAGGSLICYKTAHELGLITVVNRVLNTDSPINKYKDVFSGIGKMRNYQVKLHIDKTVKPVAQAHRRIPFHVRKQVESKLKEMENDDIIERVEGPTPWVSPIVVVPKPHNPEEIRICVDMRQPNKAIGRERHISPTVDDIISELGQAKVFSKLDLNQGYHQLELSPESRYITTFSTHVGLRRYKRLNFGVNSAAEIFQEAIKSVIDGVPGSLNISDDIIVYGSSQEEHDERLECVLERLRKNNLTLNRSKCEFNKSSLVYFGYTFSGSGVSPDPKKVDAIRNVEVPKSVKEVRSLLGLVNYCGRFIPDLANLAKPLRDLTKKDVKWHWTEEHQKSLSDIQQALSSETTLAYFQPSLETELLVDASPTGIGAILTQKENSTNATPRVICYSSRTLSEVEKRYSQIEREALAIMWGCEKYHLYLYGKSFSVVTDHKPLVKIFNDPAHQPPPRIERWILKLQPYEFTVEYRPGEDNPADYLSRHPDSTTKQSRREEKVVEEYINYVFTNAVPKALTQEEIMIATKEDATLQAVVLALNTGQWYNVQSSNVIDMATFNALARVKTDLTIANAGNTLLRGTRIVIPQSLQRRVVRLAHEGHQGIIKTKKLLREKVWFPGIDKLVEECVAECIPCQATTQVKNSEPLQMTNLPKSPWQNVSVDFCGPFPSGDYLLVVIDDHSRYPEVEILKTTSSKSTIPRLDKIFSSFGVPQEVKTDNGPPFNSTDFRTFAQYLGFSHRKITPYWPQANGEVERFMRTLEKAIRTAQIEGKPWKQELYTFLRNYRATPHSTTDVPPYDAMFQRPMKTKLPEAPKERETTAERKQDSPRTARMRIKDEKTKEEMKLYADQQRHSKTSKIEEGNVVLVRNQRQGKLQAPFQSTPYRVIRKKGSMITAQRGDRQVTRNSSHFKKINSKTRPESDHGESDESLFKEISGQHLTTQLDDETPVISNEQPLRRSSRNKGPPRYLSDYVWTLDL